MRTTPFVCTTLSALTSKILSQAENCLPRVNSEILSLRSNEILILSFGTRRQEPSPEDQLTFIHSPRPPPPPNISVYDTPEIPVNDIFQDTGETQQSLSPLSQFNGIPEMCDIFMSQPGGDYSQGLMDPPQMEAST